MQAGQERRTEWEEGVDHAMRRVVFSSEFMLRVRTDWWAVSRDELWTDRGTSVHAFVVTIWRGRPWQFLL